jgi:alpha-L-fucosidase
LGGLLVLASVKAAGAEQFPPTAPIPSPRQLVWHEMEFYGMIHFGLNTYTGREWGYGDVSPTRFNPTGFNATNVVRTFQDAGMRGLILVCKHHDGFCLWPSVTTDYSVKQSPWRDGKADFVRDIAEACKSAGLKFGVYLSPWDRNQKFYGRPEYLSFYRQQLSELLTNYGDIFISWHDGANGGEGFYGGAREKRIVEIKTYYDWPGTWSLIRKLQPSAVIFSDAGPDVRWVGNESGRAGDPCWCTLDASRCYPGMPEFNGNTSGNRNGPDWVPPECNVSIRPWWFYRESDNPKVKTADQLVDIYFDSVGRGACLDLNVPLDQTGRISDLDASSLRGMRAKLNFLFATNLASNASAIANSICENDRRFGPENLIDDNRETYWSADDNIQWPEVVLDFNKPTKLSIIRIREYLPLGQRVDSFSLAQWQNGEWHEFHHGTSIGNQRLVRFKPITTQKLRLTITKSRSCPAISELSFYCDPSLRDPVRSK